MDTIRINLKDNVAVRLADGHKIACNDITAGQPIIKYGYPIGSAICDIRKGEIVHTHNLKTALSEKESYCYEPKLTKAQPIPPLFFHGFLRTDGQAGIRNDIFIVNTVGCVNDISKKLSDSTGAFCLCHPYGCSQLGDDLGITQKVLRGLIKNPNVGGVLVLGLGCENNRIEIFRSVLGDFDAERIRFLNVQDCQNEIDEGIKIINELRTLCSHDQRVLLPFDKLKIGLKCGGSDGFSGFIANPLVGRVADLVCRMGASCVLTEVPEMFGAEKILFERCVNRDIFDKAVFMVQKYKDYFISHGQPVSENPSPGNKDGGITTLEEKSLGCVQKGGKVNISDILFYGDTVKKQDLSLLEGPGNDMVSVTNLAAAGCQMILFTTGRGTPLCGVVPTIKIASNQALYNKKPHWNDLCAVATDEYALLNLIQRIANGQQTVGEQHGYRQIAIFKDGVTL